jgi:type I restriction enzyme R subunit
MRPFSLEVNDSAVKVLGDETLRTIAILLRKYGYPPYKQEKATQTVLEQAEIIAKDWTGNGQVS